MTWEENVLDSLQNEVTVAMGSSSQVKGDLSHSEEEMERLARPGDRRRATRKRDKQGRWV